MKTGSEPKRAARRGGVQGWRVAAVVVALAAWLLPAFRLTTPITRPRRWRTWELVAEAAGRTTPGSIWPGASIAQLASLDQQWRRLAGSPAAAAGPPRTSWKWRAVEAIPAAIVIAAWAAVAAAILVGFGRWRWAATGAVAAALLGAIAAGYSLGVGWIATLIARDELRLALGAAKRHFPLAGLLHVQVRGLALQAGPGVVVMLGAFLGLLLLGREPYQREQGRGAR